MSSRGFTVIEFLLVMAIFFVIAGAAPAFYSRFFFQDAVSETAERLAGSLRSAQGLALTGKGGAPWGVSINDGSIIVFRGTSFAMRNSALDRKVSIPSSVLIAGFTETVFARVTGLPVAPATISITALGGATRTLVLNAQGVVSRQ